MLIDVHNHIGVELLFYLHGDFPYGQDIPALVERGGVHGVSHWVVFPFVTNLTCDFEALHAGKVISSGGIGDTPYIYENRRLMREVYDYFPEFSNRFLPFAMIDPNRRTERQITALKKLRTDYLFYGLKVQGTIIQSEVRGLLREGRPFLDLAREWDIPLLIHSSVAKDDPWSQADDILDIAEETPDVRFCLAHSCRFDRVCLDRLAELPNAWFDCSAHVIHCMSVEQRLPNVASGDRLFRSDYRNPTQVLADLYSAYPDNLMWGSDSPFYSWISTEGRIPVPLKSSYEIEVKCLSALPSQGLSQITVENILQFLKLPGDSALSDLADRKNQTLAPPGKDFPTASN